jgi:hypothetical protein
VEVLDANRDEDPDLGVVANQNVNLLFGLDAGDDFGIFDPIDPAFDPGNGLVAARLDRNRSVDLAAVNDDFDPARVSVLRSRGDGSFRAPRSYKSNDGPSELAAADFDNDGNRDLVASSFVDERASVLFGRGDGTFTKAKQVNLGAETENVAAGDINGDGRADFAAVQNDGKVAIGFGRASRRFRQPQDLDTGMPAHAIEIADLDGDRRRDIAVTQTVAGDDFAAVLWRLRRGFEKTPTSLALGEDLAPQSVALGDVNDDGLRDLLTGNVGGSVSVFENAGNRTFANPAPFATATGTQDVETAKIDDDDLRDVVTANDGGGDVSVLINDL